MILETAKKFKELQNLPAIRAMWHKKSRPSAHII